MQIERTLQASAPTEEFWYILAEDYANVDRWARAVQKSEPNTNVSSFSVSVADTINKAQ